MSMLASITQRLKTFYFTGLVMKKTIYFHIGYPKTATTFLQEDFFPQLKGDDFIFAGRNTNGSKFQWFLNSIIFDEDDSFEKQKVNFINILKKIKSKNILISDESLSINRTVGDYRYGSIDRNLKRIGSLISDYIDIKIIITLRRQDEALHSLYVEEYPNCVNDCNYYSEFDEFVKEKEQEAYSYNYYRVIKELTRSISHEAILILSYHDLEREPEKFFRDFSSFLNLTNNYVYNKGVKHNSKVESQHYKKTNNIGFMSRKIDVICRNSSFLTKLRYEIYPRFKILNFIWRSMKSFINSFVIKGGVNANYNIEKLTKPESDVVMEYYKESNEKLFSILGRVLW